MALFDGKLDAIDLAVIEEVERQEKLDYIMRAARESEEDTFDITPLCRNLKIKLTPDEFNWILKQIQEN